MASDAQSVGSTGHEPHSEDKSPSFQTHRPVQTLLKHSIIALPQTKKKIIIEHYENFMILDCLNSS